MAKNRWLNTKFWSDNFVVDLNPLDRYLFLYLLLNEHTNICGIYELPLKIMSNETGIEKEMLIMMLKNLIGKVYYVDGWVAIRNFEKHQSTTSDDTMKGIAREKANIPEKIWVKIEEAFCGNVPPKVSYGEPKAPYREPDILNLTSPNLTLPYLTLPNSAIAEKENQKIQNILSWYKEKIASGSRMTPAS